MSAALKLHCIAFIIAMVFVLVHGKEVCEIGGDGQCDDEKRESEETLRLILVGKTGSGKSSTGNTILGEKMFKTSVLSKSETKKAQMERKRIGRRMVEVMDSPGLFDTSLNHEEVAMEIFRALGSMSPGPHAFIYVIKIGRYTQEEYETYQRLKAYFEKVNDHMVVVFTHLDDLTEGGVSKDEFINNLDDNLKTVLHECGDRYTFFNNRIKTRNQVYSLGTIINKLGGTHYTNQFSAMAEKELRKIIAKAKRSIDQNDAYHGDIVENDDENNSEKEEKKKKSSSSFKDRQRLSSEMY